MKTAPSSLPVERSGSVLAGSSRSSTVYEYDTIPLDSIPYASLTLLVLTRDGVDLWVRKAIFTRAFRGAVILPIQSLA